MADKKVTALDALASVSADDLFLVVDDPAGTPTSKKVTAANLATYTSTGLATSASPTLTGTVTLAAGANIEGAGGTPVAIHGIELPAGHQIRFEGSTANDFETFLTVVDPTADRTITFPNATGTVALTSDLSSYATLASPTFTGTPLSTTAAVDTNTTQVATTAYVVGQGYAKLASPTLTGTPAAPTAAASTSTTQIATTAFVINSSQDDQFVLAAAIFTS